MTEIFREDINGNPHSLGEDDIKKLLLEYSLPAIVGMVIVSLYHIVDSIFIGHGIGAFAISGMAITFPIMNILSAFSTLIGVGGATLASIRLGKKDEKGAASILGHVTILNAINAFLLAGIAYCFLDPILRAFGASDVLLPYARDFMSVYLWGTPIIFVFIALNNIMRVSGYPRKAMMSSFFSVGLNVILAPLFIFVFKWGMKGAALATVLSQLLGLVWVLSHFLDKKSYIHFTKGFHRLSFKTTKSMLSIGISPFLMNLCWITVFSSICVDETRERLAWSIRYHQPHPHAVYLDCRNHWACGPQPDTTTVRKIQSYKFSNVRCCGANGNDVRFLSGVVSSFHCRHIHNHRGLITISAGFTHNSPCPMRARSLSTTFSRSTVKISISSRSIAAYFSIALFFFPEF